MKSQTAREPQNQRSTRASRPEKAKPRRYVRQTALVAARRDGKPLIFGWGSHLSQSEKNRIRVRATWALTILILLTIVGVLIGFWININVIVPGLPITSVNGHDIPQSEYHKLVVLKTQLEINKLYGPNGLFAQRTNLEKAVAQQQQAMNNASKKIDDLNQQISKLPAGPSPQRTQLTKELNEAKQAYANAQSQHDKLQSQLNNLTQNTIPFEQQGPFTQSQIGNDSATWLQDDELIREWLQTQPASVRARIEPTAAQIERALNDLKANMPKSGQYARSYQQMLAQDGVSDADMHEMMALKLRRDNMQNYLASQIKSPTYQVLARTMTLSTKADAQKILDQLKKGADFATLARQKSVDTTTNTKGGYLGWLARGQYAHQEGQAYVDNWLFDPARTINEISPIIMENGAYHIVQILGIDPSRPLDQSTLQTLKDNALSNWSLEIRALPTTHITPADQNRLFDPINMPTELPVSGPSQSSGGLSAPSQ
ncbi:peptidylprolyl isomerase [Thermogemmatispora sp.]|uniref:peptidylprolyl isomerase n=1 Tax=Thermogemmatispora sp. TaxID=1968838 RepID=UPI0035E42687